MTETDIAHDCQGTKDGAYIHLDDHVLHPAEFFACASANTRQHSLDRAVRHEIVVLLYNLHRVWVTRKNAGNYLMSRAPSPINSA